MPTKRSRSRAASASSSRFWHEPACSAISSPTPRFRSIIGQIGELPQLPSTYQRLVRVLDDEKSVTADVAAVVNSDIAAHCQGPAAGELGIVRRRVATSPRSSRPSRCWAARRLKTLFLTSALFGAPSIPAHLRPFAEDLHEHSALIARLASELVGASDRRDGVCRRNAARRGDASSSLRRCSRRPTTA